MTKIIDLLKKNKKTMSVEVFPPKTETGFDSVRKAAEKIAELKPLFMSVTYGAGGGTSAYTTALARDLQEAQPGMPVLAHLTCVSSDRDTVEAKIKDMISAGIENVMALRGDIPADRLNADRSTWDYNYASELVTELRESGADFCIGGACYPEMHPESIDRASDINALKIKVEAGCDFLTTQMFFDNDAFYRFIDICRERGITVPVLPGIMPITTIKQVERSVKLSGCSLPERFTHIAAKYGDDPEDMYKAGIEYAEDQISDLYNHGVTNIHLYSMNNPDVASEIMRTV